MADGKYSMLWHTKPEDCSTAEAAVAMMMAATLADARKLGLDPRKIHVTLEFKDSARKVCFTLGAPPQDFIITN